MNTYVRWDVGGHITTLSLNDGQSSEGSSTELVVHLGCTLEETRVEVEDITGVGLTTGGATQQKGHLTVSDGLLGQIVVDDKSYNFASVHASYQRARILTVLAVVTEPFTHRASREGSEVLQGGGLRGGSGNDDGVLHGIVLFKRLHELGDG